MLPKGYRPQAALGPGDFPCKWRFDIKTLCLRALTAGAARASASPLAELFQNGKVIEFGGRTRRSQQAIAVRNPVFP